MRKTSKRHPKDTPKTFKKHPKDIQKASKRHPKKTSVQLDPQTCVSIAQEAKKSVWIAPKPPLLHTYDNKKLFKTKETYEIGLPEIIFRERL